MKALYLWPLITGVLLVSTMAMGSDRLVLAEEELTDVTVLDFRFDSVIVYTDDGENEQFLLLTDIEEVALESCPKFAEAEAYLADDRYRQALLTYRKCRGESDNEWYASLLAARMQYCEDNMPAGTILPAEDDTPEPTPGTPVEVETPILEEVTFDDMPVGEAIDALAMMADYTIEIDWDALGGLDISPDAAISVDGGQIALQDVLTAICEQLDERVVLTRWNTDDCSVKITSAEAIADNTGRYYVIPLQGTIGREALPSTLEKSLNVASAQGANTIVLHIDSGGGMITVKDDILDLLRDKKDDFRIVAYITEAHSAAAMIALLCDEIIMAPGAAMGSCVPYVMRNGTPEMVSAKFLAAELAKIRATAEEGGHNPLLAEAMISYEMLLSYNEPDEEGGEIEIVKGRGDQMIKNTREILNLSANEAVKYGLSLGIADDVEDLHELLGVDGWEEVSRRGYAIQSDWETEYEALMDDIDDTIDDYNDKWDDLIDAARAGRKSRAFRLINQLQQELLGLKNRLKKYEDDVPGFSNDVGILDEWLEDLAEIEEDIERW